MRLKVIALIIIGCWCMLIIGCKNDPVATKAIYGDWLWVKTTGGIAGITETPQSTKSSLVWTFLHDDRIFGIKNNKDTTVHGFFKISNGAVPGWPGNNKLLLIRSTKDTPDSLANTYLLYECQDSLVVSEPYADGFNFTFRRKIPFGLD